MTSVTLTFRAMVIEFVPHIMSKRLISVKIFENNLADVIYIAKLFGTQNKYLNIQG